MIRLNILWLEHLKDLTIKVRLVGFGGIYKISNYILIRCSP